MSTPARTPIRTFLDTPPSMETVLTVFAVAATPFILLNGAINGVFKILEIVGSYASKAFWWTVDLLDSAIQ